MVNAIFFFLPSPSTFSGQKPSFWLAGHCSSHYFGRRATSESRGGSAESADRSYMSVGRSADEKSPAETRFSTGHCGRPDQSPSVKLSLMDRWILLGHQKWLPMV